MQTHELAHIHMQTHKLAYIHMYTHELAYIHMYTHELAHSTSHVTTENRCYHFGGYSKNAV